MSKNNEQQNIMELYPCQLRQINLSCYGCCGDDWGAKSEIENDIKLNSRDFKEIYTESNCDEDDLRFFKDRFDKQEVSSSGVCLNLVDFGSGCTACPLHPLVNKVVSKDNVVAPKKDLRVGHCDINFECESVKHFKLFNSHQRKEFLKWLSEKNYTNYKYSMLNISGELIKLYFSENNKLK